MNDKHMRFPSFILTSETTATKSITQKYNIIITITEKYNIIITITEK